MSDLIAKLQIPDNPDWALETDLRWTDLEGQLISISAAAAQALGSRGRPPKIGARSDCAEYRGQFQSYLDTIQRGMAKGLLALQTSGGTRRCEMLESAPRRSGLVDRHRTARDVTELVQTERVLRASNRLPAFIQPHREGDYDSRRACVDERAFERQMGYTRAEVIGRTSLELNVWPTSAHRVAIPRRCCDEAIRLQNAEFRTKSGRMIATVYSAAS
jgi:PAS domain-containing protein